MRKGGWVYMLADRYRGAIYIGVTAHIAARSFQHATKAGSEFCRKYNITRLVYANFAEDITDAIAREKAMKKWRRQWKIDLIEQANPDWQDMFAHL
jgi:putative endonuclease